MCPLCPGLLLLPHQQHVRPALATPRHFLVFHQHSEGGAHGVPGGERDIKNISLIEKYFAPGATPVQE